MKWKNKGQSTIAIIIIIIIVAGIGIYLMYGQGGEEEPIEVSNLEISPQENIVAGSDVNISVLAKNTSDTTESKVISLNIEGSEEMTENVELDAGENRTVSFTVTRDENGIYNASIDGLSGEFAVGMILPKEEIKNPNTLIVDRIGAPRTLDPAWCYDTASSEIIMNVYETLISYDGKSTDEFVPELATEWESQDNGMTWRFKIRENVEFQNGNELTPEDVEYSFERVMVQDRSGGPATMLLKPLVGVDSTRDGDGELKVSFENIDSSVETDGQWVVFNFSEVFPGLAWKQILCHTVSSVVDQEWTSNHGAWPGTAGSWEDYNDPQDPVLENMNGTGPFELSNWDKNIQVTLSRNDDYWREPASLQQLKIKAVEEWGTRKFEFLSGDADIIDVPISYIEQLEGAEGIKLRKNLPTLTTTSAFFSFDVSPESDYIGSGELDGNGIPENFFSDKHIRKGFAYSFDYQTLIEDVRKGEGISIPGPIPKGMAYYNGDQQKYSLDIEKAEEEFKKAYGGSVNDPGPVWENGFKMTIVYNAGNEERRVAGEIFKEKVEKINDKFEVEVRSIQWPSFLEATVYPPSTAPLYVLGWIADYPSPFNFAKPHMSSEGTFSGIQGYSNPTVDNLLDQAMKATSEDERRQIYHELQSIYYKDVPSISLYQPTGRMYMRSWVNGWYYNPVYGATQLDAYTISKEAET